MIQIRCSDEEKARWTKQAGTRTLTDYFKYLADQDSGLEADVMREFEKAVPPGPVAGLTTVISKESLMSIPRPLSSEKRSFKPDWKVPAVKKTPKGSVNSSSSKAKR